MTEPSMTIAFFYIREKQIQVGVNMAEESKQIYGGQAVIEGVMFGGREYTVTAVRRKDKSIEFYRLPRVRNKALSILKIHFTRNCRYCGCKCQWSKAFKLASERFDVHPEETNKLQIKRRTIKINDGIRSCRLVFYLSYSEKYFHSSSCTTS